MVTLPLSLSAQNRWSRHVHYLRIAAEKEVEFLKVFDGPAVTECYTRRPSVVPQQALALANSELALDRTSESFPVLQFTPSVTAQYRIRVGMEECRVNPCWYGAGVIRSRGAKP